MEEIELLLGVQKGGAIPEADADDEANQSLLQMISQI